MKGRETAKPTGRVAPRASAGSLVAESSRRWKVILAVGGLALMTMAVYWPLHKAGYFWDDAQWVTNNPLVHHWRGFAIFWLHPEAMDQYYPLTFSFLSVEYHLWGLQTLPYHLVNVLFQAANATLLWLVLRRLELRSAWLIAALFAIHPVQVETVAWVSEIKNLLSGFFYLLALLLFLRFVGIGCSAAWTGESKAPVKPHGNHQLYILATILFLLGLLSKTAVCTLPPAMLVILWWKGRWRDKDAILHLIPWFLIAFVIGLVTIHVEHTSTGAHGPDWRFSIVQRMQIAGHAFWFYLMKLCWPHPLLMVYPRWAPGPSMGLIWLIAAVGLFAALWLLRGRTGRGPLAAMLFYLVTIGPVLGFISFYTQLYSFVADHYQYLACIGPMALAGELIYWAADQSAKWRSAIPVIAAAMILPVMGWITLNQSRLYDSDYTLWHYVYRHNRNSFIVKALYGATLLERPGMAERGLVQLAAANAMHPHIVPVVFNLAGAYMLTGHYHRAIHYYAWYLLHNPDSVDAWTDSANCLLALRAYTAAAKDLEMACTLKPDFAIGWMELAHVSYLAGHRRYAEQFYQRAIRLNPSLAKFKAAIFSNTPPTSR